MKRVSIFVGLLALLTLASAWDKDDREIFRIRDEVSVHEKPGTTFYDVLGITLTASLDDINKAYRRLSKALHPDKVQQRLRQNRNDQAQQTQQQDANGKHHQNKNNNNKPPGLLPSEEDVRAAVKTASERQARLLLIANILKGPGRDRYDHFLRNGFPVWKGTEYYYQRYRPGLPAVILGLFLVGGGGIHYLALYMSWRRKRDFVERYIHNARDAAWGGKFTDIPGIDGPAAAAAPVAAADPIIPDDGENEGPPRASNRKQRRIQERASAKKDAAKDTTKKSKKRPGDKQPIPQSSPARKRVVAENGKVMMVDSMGNVYLQQEDGDGNVEELLVDPNEFPRPQIQDTLLVRIPLWLYQSATTHLLGRKPSEAGPILDAPDAIRETIDDDESDEVQQHTPSSVSSDGFELLDQSFESDSKLKSTGLQIPSVGKAGKRAGRTR